MYLEEVLDDADLLQECKASNEKLTEFLQRTENISRLLDYVVGNIEVTAGSSLENQENVGFKYV